MLCPQDGDGQLDASELVQLANQFNEQVKLSNSLLEQIQGLEEKSFNQQKDMQEKQVALRQALAVCDASREEGTELKRKLAVQTVCVPCNRGPLAAPLVPPIAKIAEK